MDDKVIYEEKVDYLPCSIAEKLNITTKGRLKKRSSHTTFGHYTLAEINDDFNLNYSMAKMADFIDRMFASDNFMSFDGTEY